MTPFESGPEDHSDSSEFDFSNVLESMSTAGVFAVDRRLNVIFWNRFMEVHSKLKASEVLNQSLPRFFPELKEGWFAKKVRSVMVLGNQSYTNWTQRPYLLHFPSSQYSVGDVDHMYQNCAMWPLRDTKGVVQGVCVSVHDVTEMAMAQKMLEDATEQALEFEESSNRDEMTGLYNRRYFFEQLNHDIARCKRYDWPMVVAIFDVDKFKDVNDTYGHPAGDEVLIEIGNRIQTCLRSSDTLCRFGGEEFALLLPNLPGSASVSVLNRLRESICATPIQTEHHQISVSISIGGVQFEFDKPSKDALSEADKALYEAKLTGRNKVVMAN
ncbi:diguanylate cyclase [uncultured Ferrimonas sp.]|uniref:sensor domain-containing diguanylate cyclase n=1 Tax=uncultured Ferrimonas sp. TaxID=432640 RepID=UPI002619D15F|nr:diguanylate cyclase [uncultured Ferrimonas sp.]